MSDKTQLIGLAAEYAVASELCKRNIYAQLTLGLRKRTDILIETEDSMLRIQVKGKKGKEWPACTGIYGKNVILIFVDFENKNENERPDFYILTEENWKALIEDELKKISAIKKGDVIVDEKNIPSWRGKYQGLGVKPIMINKYKEKWEKIKSLLGIDVRNNKK